MTPPILQFNGKYRFLSNFWPLRINYKGRSFLTVEHAFQSQKTLVESERYLINWIVDRGVLRPTTPGEAKRAAGKKANPPITLRADWEDVKLPIMEELLRIKFTDPGLRRQLLSTGDASLMEGNVWGDSYWGVCDGIGENHLGLLLEKIRAEINS